jgi:hypothetical protein
MPTPLAPRLPNDTRQMPPDLALVVESWEELPEALRAGILAMVEASGRRK